MIIICLIKAISPDRCQHSLDAINKKHMQGEDTELTKPPFLSPHYHHRKDGETHTTPSRRARSKVFVLTLAFISVQILLAGLDEKKTKRRNCAEINSVAT